jgi:hypothetical protein
VTVGQQAVSLCEEDIVDPEEVRRARLDLGIEVVGPQVVGQVQVERVVEGVAEDAAHQQERLTIREFISQLYLRLLGGSGGPVRRLRRRDQGGDHLCPLAWTISAPVKCWRRMPG